MFPILAWYRHCRPTNQGLGWALACLQQTPPKLGGRSLCLPATSRSVCCLGKAFPVLYP